LKTDDTEVVIAAVVLAQRFQCEFMMGLQLPPARQANEGFGFLRQFEGRRSDLIVEAASATVQHNQATGCKICCDHGKINIKAAKYKLGEILYEVPVWKNFNTFSLDEILQLY
jgi:hypothetical protein